MASATCVCRLYGVRRLWYNLCKSCWAGCASPDVTERPDCSLQRSTGTCRWPDNETFDVGRTWAGGGGLTETRPKPARRTQSCVFGFNRKSTKSSRKAEYVGCVAWCVPRGVSFILYREFFYFGTLGGAGGARLSQPKGRFLLRKTRKSAERTELASPTTPPRGIRGRLDAFSPTRALGLQLGSRFPWARKPNRLHFGRKSESGRGFNTEAQRGGPAAICTQRREA